MNEKLKFEPVVYPKKEIVAFCPECGKELARTEWGHYEDYKRQKRKIGQAIKSCPHCEALLGEQEEPKPKWEKTSAGDYIAKAKNGDFLIWKYGYGYKWRYRKYGEQSPKGISWCRTRAEAQRACERHEEWKA